MLWSDRLVLTEHPSKYNTNISRMQTCPPTEICIVGASYAGLALARTLHAHHPKQFNIQLFEMRARTDLADFSSSLLFHNQRVTLTALNLPNLIETLNDGNGNGRTSKCKLFEGLCSSVPKNLIHYQTRVVDLVWDSQLKKMVVAVENREDKVVHLSFDWVVSADGLTSSTRKMAMDVNDAAPHLLLGDATRQFGRELCFGLPRTRYGASSAMADAVTLGRLLGSKNGLNGSESTEDVFCVYRFHAWEKRRWRNTVMLMMTLFLVVWLALVGGNINSGVDNKEL